MINDDVRTKLNDEVDAAWKDYCAAKKKLTDYDHANLEMPKDRYYKTVNDDTFYKLNSFDFGSDEEYCLRYYNVDIIHIDNINNAYSYYNSRILPEYIETKCESITEQEWDDSIRRCSYQILEQMLYS